MVTDNTSRTITSNTAFYHVCYRLSKSGWHVEPSGSSPFGRTLSIRRPGASALTVKVKGVRGLAAAGFGTGVLNLAFDYVVVVDISGAGEPTSYILSAEEVRSVINTNVKDAKSSHWLEIRDYTSPQHLEQWQKIGIG